jgi:hypothetical protein
MASMANQFDREQRWTNMRKAPKPSLETRVALIVHQRGITKRQLAKFYTLRGKRFDYDALQKNIISAWNGYRWALWTCILVSRHCDVRSALLNRPPRLKCGSSSGCSACCRKATAHGCPT